MLEVSYMPQILILNTDVNNNYIEHDSSITTLSILQ